MATGLDWQRHNTMTIVFHQVCWWVLTLFIHTLWLWRIDQALQMFDSWHKKLRLAEVADDGNDINSSDDDSTISSGDDVLALADESGKAANAAIVPKSRRLSRSKAPRISHSKDFHVVRRVLPPTTLGRGPFCVGFGGDGYTWRYNIISKSHGRTCFCTCAKFVVF